MSLNIKNNKKKFYLHTITFCINMLWITRCRGDTFYNIKLINNITFCTILDK